MGNSVEGRFPFVDVPFAELAARLPGLVAAARACQEKYALRKAVSRVLPDAIRARPKVPYRAPIRDVFFGPRAAATLVERGGRCATAGLLDADRGRPARGQVPNGRPVGETDEMALAGSVSLMILHDRLVANPGRRPRSAGPRAWSATRSCRRPFARGGLMRTAARPRQPARLGRERRRTRTRSSTSTRARPMRSCVDDALRFARALQDRGSRTATGSRCYLDNTCRLRGRDLRRATRRRGVRLVNPQTKATSSPYILDDSGADVLVSESLLGAGSRQRRGAEVTVGDGKRATRPATASTLATRSRPPSPESASAARSRRSRRRSSTPRAPPGARRA